MRGIISADSHIGDFRSHNIANPEYRLEQFGHLYSWFNSLNPEFFINAGDLFHSSTCTPRELLAGIQALRNLSCPIYLCHGNHDLDINRDIERFDQNTYLSLAHEFDNIFYYHREMVEIGGLQFYFKGWEWDYNLDEIESCDVAIGHINVLGSKMGSSDYTLKHGTTLDLTKFKLAFMGDIHRHQILHDTVIVPGTPLQNSFSDFYIPGVILFDTDTLEWEFIKTPETINGVPRLQFIVSEKVQDNQYIISKKPKQALKVGTKVTAAFENLQPLTLLDHTITKEKNEALTKLHSDIMDQVDLTEETTPNLYFELLQLKITNFLTIASFNLKFGDVGQVSLISGENGTGKSSFLNAIKFALFGIGNYTELVKWETDSMEVELEFQYGEHLYSITRGRKKSTSFCEISIDGVTVDRGKFAQTCSFIKSEIEFMTFDQLLVFDQDRIGFLSNISYTNRVELLTRLLGLEVLTKINLVVSGQYNVISTELSLFDSTITSYNRTITDLEDTLLQSDNLEPEMTETKDIEIAEIKEIEIDKTSLSIDMEKYKKQRTKFNTLLTDLQTRINAHTSAVQQYHTACSQLTGAIQGKETKLTSLKSSLCYTCNQPVGLKKVEKMKKKIKDEIIDLQTKLDSLEEPTNTALSGFKKGIVISQKKIDIVQEKIDAILKVYSEIEATKKANLKVIEANKRAIEANKRAIEANKRAIEANKRALEANKRAKDKLETVKVELKEASATRLERLESLEVLEQYMALVSPTGDITAHVLSHLAKEISNDLFKIETCKILKNKKIKPDFDVSFRLNEKWVKYKSLSGGEKNLVDLYVLSKLFKIAGGAGLLLLDETLKTLDKPNTEIAVSILQELEVDKCFIISHNTNFPYYDTQISATNIKGTSKYTIR